MEANLAELNQKIGQIDGKQSGYDKRIDEFRADVLSLLTEFKQHKNEISQEIQSANQQILDAISFKANQSEVTEIRLKQDKIIEDLKTKEDNDLIWTTKKKIIYGVAGTIGIFIINVAYQISSKLIDQISF